MTTLVQQLSHDRPGTAAVQRLYLTAPVQPLSSFFLHSRWYSCCPPSSSTTLLHNRLSAAVQPLFTAAVQPLSPLCSPPCAATAPPTTIVLLLFPLLPYCDLQIRISVPLWLWHEVYSAHAKRERLRKVVKTVQERISLFEVKRREYKSSLKVNTSVIQ